MTENFNEKKYNYIFCDSFDALEYYYKIGLKKNIPVITSSPKILSLKKINSINLYKNWNTSKFQKFQKSILDFTLEVFKDLNSGKSFSREERLLVAIYSNRYHNFLLKSAQLEENLKKKKILFIKVSEQIYNFKPINPPWDYLFKKNKNFEIITFYPIKKNSVSSKTNFLERLYMGGLETAFFRIFSFLSTYLRHLSNKRLIIISENELLIEASIKFLFKGYIPINLNALKKEKLSFQEKKIKTVKKLIKNTISRRISKYVKKTYRKDCANYFFENLNNFYGEYQYWVLYFEKNIDNLYKDHNKSVLLSNHPANPKGLAAKNVFNKRNIKLISFQHGVAAEISGSHDNVLSQHDSSASDQYYAFNKKAVDVARENPFNKASHDIYGIPKRYKRQNNIFKFNKKYPILFLSNKLYRGNDGGIHVWVDDYEFNNIESKLIKTILRNTNKKVFYKPYPASFDRYIEKDPLLEEIEKYKNISIVEDKKDARYLTGKSKLIICTTASSTLSWALMADTPLVFINIPTAAPLKKEAIHYFDKGLFLFSYDKQQSLENLRKLLSLPFRDINKLWKDKKNYRRELIENFVSSSKNLSHKDII